MKKSALLMSVVALAATSCAPAVTQEVTAPNVYAATPEQVYNEVLAVISTDPGVPAYSLPLNILGENMKRIPTGPWVITQSDRVGGFIRASAQSTRVTTFGSDSGERDNHYLSVVITGQNDPARSQVVVQGSERVGYMFDKINSALAAKYKKLQ